MFALFILAIVASVAVAHIHERVYYEEKFFNWMKQHKMRAKGGKHFVDMLRNFADNDDFIAQHNADKKHSYTLGHNRFSHLSNAEYQEFLKLREVESRAKAKNIHKKTGDVPDEKDWTKEGAVTDVKDQGQCGSCWAFSTTGSLEGALYLKSGRLESLSEQQFVDCDDVDHGCDGGLMDQAFQWAHDYGGVAREGDYPYKAIQGTCDTKVKSIPAAAPQSFTDVEPDSVDAMSSAIAQQPVSIAIDAGRLTFQLYEKGVYDDPACGTRLNHGVLAVGYGKSNGKDFFKVKNSWGPYWGDHGYILLAKGGDVNEKGQCGMLQMGSYPNL